MKITFLTQSQKSPATIYVRIRDKSFDVKARTKFSVNPAAFSDGAIKKYKELPGSLAVDKQKVRQQNESLIKLERELADLKSNLTSRLNLRADYEKINKFWLEEFLSPTKEDVAPSRLSEYFEYYIDCKDRDIAASTKKKLRVFKNRIVKFETDKLPVYIENVNMTFSVKFEKWMRSENYAKNTIIKTIKTIKEICNHSKLHGVAVHPELQQLGLGKEYRYVRTDKVFLTLSEIKKIENLVINDDLLNAAKDWLIISCYTAQRVSDFFRFRTEDIVVMAGNKFIDFRQKKTDEPLFILLHPPVLEIIKKRNGFPPLFSTKPESNSSIYNKLIKLVCKEAGINNKVQVNVKDNSTKRYESKEMAKYKAVSTHIGRRSFATNYYGKIDTSLLMSQTGHKSEKMFLEYVGKSNATNAIALAQGFERLFSLETIEAPMKILKNG